MKEIWNSIFRTVSESVKTLRAHANKKARHDVVLMATGISVVTMLTFTVGDLNGNGGSKMIAFAETPAQSAEVQEDAEAEIENLEQLLIGTEHNDDEKAVLEFGTVDHAQEAQDLLLGADETEVDEEHNTESEAEEEEEVAAVTDLIEETEESVALLAASEAVEDDKSDADAVVLSSDEYQVLLKIVQAEAGTCDEMGKLLVANVILNRMESDEFPDTVSGVVYQKRQFSPVMNGTINTCKISMETRSAVNRALNGEDYSEGALYFMNRSKSAGRNVRWFDANLDYLFKHGEHEFFK